MYCTNCGYKNSEDAIVCESCGQPIEGRKQAQETGPEMGRAQGVQMQSGQPTQSTQPAQSNGMAIASLVLGIVAVIFMFFGAYAWIGAICGIIGIVLAVRAKKVSPSGMATAGLVLSIIAVAINLIVTVACIALIGGLSSVLSGM